jgi:ferredoxin-NADP reductase
LYVVADAQEFAYQAEFEAAAQIGVRLIRIVTDTAYNMPGILTGRIGADMLKQCIPDYAERIFYLSGPNAMVEATKRHLHALNVPNTRIRTDHFSGY